MWKVDGLYSKKCLEELRIPRVTMVDTHESENWNSNPSLRAGIDFRKGDFSDERFMATISNSYDIALAYDVLLHQIDLRHTLALMVSKATKWVLISQPILPDELMPYRNCLILLPGSRAYKLIPFRGDATEQTDYWKGFSDATITCTGHWLWGMTPSSVESLMAGLGWVAIHKEFWRGWLPRFSKWKLCGMIFRRSTQS